MLSVPLIVRLLQWMVLVARLLLLLLMVVLLPGQLAAQIDSSGLELAHEIVAPLLAPFQVSIDSMPVQDAESLRPSDDHDQRLAHSQVSQPARSSQSWLHGTLEADISALD